LEGIIKAGGGSVVVTKNSLSKGVKEFLANLNEGCKLCVMPESMKKSKLIITLLENGFTCVSVKYVYSAIVI
jgi:hypothetical protein